MYIPEHFQYRTRRDLHALIASHPLGILVTNGPQGLDANHIPFEREPGKLLAHVARANPVWREVRTAMRLLVIFRAEQAYISPNWYPSKQENHKSVPNLELFGRPCARQITIRDDERFVRGIVAKLTHHHEAAQPEPWKMSDAPKDYIADMVKAIVGIEIEIVEITGKFKLKPEPGKNATPEVSRTISSGRGDDILGQAVLTARAGKSD